jgi:hypothetical protein
LNEYLSRVGIVDEAEYSYSSDKEMTKHLILSYLRWIAERKELRIAVCDRLGDVTYLLGGWDVEKDARIGQLLDSPKGKWKPDLEAVKATIGFLEKTGRLIYLLEVMEAI